MSYQRANAAKADSLAADFRLRSLTPENAGFTDVRDFCDVSTGSEMTAHQLDRLTEMVLRRVGLDQVAA